VSNSPMRSLLDSKAPIRGLATLGLLVGVFVAASSVHAEEPTATAKSCDEARAKAVAASVQRYYDAIEFLSADFTQTTESVVMATGGGATGDSDGIRSGHVNFAKPGRMRWVYDEPEQSLVISDGSVIWVYEIGARQATRIPGAEQYLAGAALQFLLGEGDLAATFDIEALDCSKDHVALELMPRQPTSFERLGLTADPSTGSILETSIVDLFGNRTRIRFQNVAVGQPPAEGLFEFDPPSGVEVIELGESQ